jgi:hypothetical protein
MQTRTARPPPGSSAAVHLHALAQQQLWSSRQGRVAP